MLKKIQELLGKEADELLNYKAKFPKEQLNLPGPDFVDRVFLQTDRSPNVLKNLKLDSSYRKIIWNRLRLNSSCRPGN
ncbi:MAG: hypothetical protein U5J96_20040 [Ignavibacteriaceae bacterium]|nr:hypothetical protein [Ignavibacteriaceae bacterium]